MKRPFREHHLFEILTAYEIDHWPLDLFLKNYFKANHAVGSKDRKWICDTLYTMIRWRGLLDHLSPSPASWEKRYSQIANFSPERYLKDPSIPDHIRFSFPKQLFTLFVDSLGQEKAEKLCAASNGTAPTTIRINRLKAERESLLEKWSAEWGVKVGTHASTALSFPQKMNFFSMQEFKEGFFEVQDEASQLIAELVAVKPGDLVLDYCAGAGGKSLAIAPNMEQKGQLYLHDIRTHALKEAKKRLRRAGIQNAQLLFSDALHKKSLKGKMDWVLVDAPCTGTGTLRRNPDMKWKFELATLTRLIVEQRKIFEEALPFVKSGGHIVYATCSVFPQENEEQAAYFAETFGLKQLGAPFTSFPEPGGMDGFFGVVFEVPKLSSGSTL